MQFVVFCVYTARVQVHTTKGGAVNQIVKFMLVLIYLSFGVVVVVVTLFVQFEH